MIITRTAAKIAAATATTLIIGRVIQCTIWHIRWAIEDRHHRAEQRARNIEFATNLQGYAASRTQWAQESRARGDHATAEEYEAEASRQSRAATALLAKGSRLSDAIEILHPELA
ncbi:Uncharacterised protein [Mycobacteroides abscessus subsp. massiliense]|uniref:hypothetical protein n=1 Tax=Mycobacteroides abscessus TaxID=36809 RepID=UPI0009A634AE|nr:hypothetical protein [Mycobacteroides abscessus]MBN7324387.1 hypothetical protein [Mycobacteroides abscessus subsp. massiliense]SKL15425.1 Uncharacterised protein [Mycobacteroides abscessus subsp. massiliense]SKL96344.1 Uncharacterised protein [Mycobacteroides abscessus subsp. massiliense]SKM76820.1 Uncharacterised protein [Mycobacteroides abscessus subsp. massiliense]